MTFVLECELWEGHVNEKGYGSSHGRLVHRRAYERAYGSVSGSDVVHHLCGVPRCVNLDHLITMSRGAHTTLHKKGVFASHCGVCGSPRRRTSTGAWYCRPCGTERQRERRTKNTGSWLI